ncbi:hypothetical protein [Streptomyces sp. NPDC003514]
MSRDSDAGPSWFAHTDTTGPSGPRRDVHAGRPGGRTDADGPLDATTRGDAFVITELPEPPSSAPETDRTVPDPDADRTRVDRAGLWERLGDRKATAVTAAVAGGVLLGVLLVMSMVTDGITFTSDATQPAGDGTSIITPTELPGGAAPAAPSPPDESPTPEEPPAADSPSPSDPASGRPGGTASPDDDDDHDDDDDDDDDDADDHDDDDDDDDDDD